MSDSYFSIDSPQSSSHYCSHLSLTPASLPSGRLEHTTVADAPAPAPTTSAAQYPDLQLSGHVISAGVCIPYELNQLTDGTWQVNPRRGNSALFDAFSYLGTSSTWKHTVVGWTGEIFPTKPRRFSNTVAQQRLSQIQQFPSTSDVQVGRPGLQLHSLASLKLRQDLSARSVEPQTDILAVSSCQRKNLEELLSANCSSTKVVPVWLDEKQNQCFQQTSADDIHLRDQGRWRKYAECHLYPVFHYGHQAFGNDDNRTAIWSDYVTLNQAIANKIIGTYKPGDLVFIHDYHLMLVPTMLRRQFPNIYVGYFLHIPFPSSEYVKELPERRELLDGMLDADVLFFQTASFAQHFKATCQRILHDELNADEAGNSLYTIPHRARVEVIPIGIDGQAISDMAFEDAEVEQELIQLRQIYAGKKVVIGRDRLESVRGVSQKLEAFERFLELYPEWRKRAVLIQITRPVDTLGDRKVGKYESLVSSIVSRINGKYGAIDHEPVRYYPQYFSVNQYSALLRLADVGLITSVRDGMNTTGLEFVICQDGKHSPLILSEFSGTATVLSTAPHINPWNYREVAQRLKQCLEMTEDEKRTMHEQLYGQVMKNSSGAWSEKLISSLCSNVARRGQLGALPALSTAVLRDRYQSTCTRLLLFDYDGTLANIEQHPDAAIPTERMLEALESLVKDTRNQVWIISGRDMAFLQTHLGHIFGLGLSAEHGCFMRAPGSTEWTNLAAKMDMTWQTHVSRHFENTTRAVPGSWIETKKVALTWHYRSADDYAQGEAEAANCKALLEATVARDYEVDVLAGKANLEVRPRLLNKGYVARKLVKKLASDSGRQVDFVLCCGDDQTDEDMFKALVLSNLSKEAVFTCTVGPKNKQTVAGYALEGPEDVIEAIHGLVQATIRR